MTRDVAAATTVFPEPLDIRRLLTNWWPALLGLRPSPCRPSDLAGRPGFASRAPWPHRGGHGLWLLARQMTGGAPDGKAKAWLWLSALGLILGLATTSFGGPLISSASRPWGCSASVWPCCIRPSAWPPWLGTGSAVLPGVRHPAARLLIDKITAPLKQFVSEAAMRSLYAVGLPCLPRRRHHLRPKYQLLMEDACSG